MYKIRNGEGRAGFTIREILTATRGRLMCGNLRRNICGISIDSRSVKRGELFIAIKGEHFDGHSFIQQAIDKRAAAVILRSGSRQNTRLPRPQKITFIQVADTLKALGDIAHYHRQRFNIPLVAVTGSNGKTTTKEMIAATLKRRYCVLKNEATLNNLIGIPLCLLKLEAKYEVAVVEMGMSRFGEIARLTRIAQPSLGVITNIGPSHLHSLGDLSAVAKAKAELLKNLNNDATAILNKDDNFFETISNQNLRAKLITFGVDKPSNFQITQYSYQNGKLHFIVNHRYPFFLKMLGEHNLYNALASIAVCAQLNVNYGLLMRSLASFRTLPSRLEVKKVGRLTIINDTYNSNPQSLTSALRLLLQYKCREKKILVIGDMLELGPKERRYHALLGKIIGDSKIDILVTFGELSKVLAQSARKKRMGKGSIFICNNKHKVLEVLLDKVSPGDVILIKGSRAMKMEEITRCFITSYTL